MFFFFEIFTIQDHEISLEELHRLSDELEFKQTEIMNAKDKLRSIQAKLAVQQGKMTHVIMSVLNPKFPILILLMV